MNAITKIRALGVMLSVLAAAGAPGAGPTNPVRAGLDPIAVLSVRPGERAHDPGPAPDQCEVYASHTTHQFINQPPGTPVIIQAGFAEQEIAAAVYTLPATSFPLRIRSVEMLFGTIANVPTTTEWSVLVWSGFPNTGTLVAEFSSDGVELQHLEMPPAVGGFAQGTVIQFIVDPFDPEQIVIDNAGGSNTFTVGFRIDNHNNQIQNPCITPPPSASNAFPVTFNDGQQALTGNWLKAVNCGVFGCPPNGGWASFQALSPGICRPTGDWVLRAQWEPLSCGTPCYADCNDSGSLTVADFTCFQNRFVAAEPYADCNQSGTLTVADFTCFQSAFVAGCP